MRIEKVKIKNYKLFQDFTMLFNDDLNIIVGDNEAGKSTLLEAIGLALTSQIAGRNIQYELSPFLFNMGVVKEYIDGLQNNPATPLPQILIEVFLKEDFEGELAQYKGTNNSERLDCAGVYFQIAFDKDYAPEYQAYIANTSEVRTIPIEYYSCTWLSFANNTFKFSQLPSKIVLLDRSDQRLQNGSDKYIAKIIDDTLDKSESALLSLLYRKQKEILAEQDSMKKINERISANKEEITTRDLSVSIDISARSNWDANLSLYVDDVPFKFIGKGEQGAIKTKLALQTRMEKSQVIMIEEPETNLSYTNLNKLVSSLVKSCHEKQLIVTTHSTFLMNKIGIDRNDFLPITPPVILCIIICCLDFQNRCFAVWQFDEVVNVRQHIGVDRMIKHLLHLINPKACFHMENFSYQILKQMTDLFCHPVAFAVLIGYDL